MLRTVYLLPLSSSLPLIGSLNSCISLLEYSVLRFYPGESIDPKRLILSASFAYSLRTPILNPSFEN
nr:MAG TPA: hypothetical protein [Caudoviricetes sp.]